MPEILGVEEARNLKFFQARVYLGTDSEQLPPKLGDKTSYAATYGNL